jgi:DNA-binding CsgD family transcriptional regulator
MGMASAVGRKANGRLNAPTSRIRPRARPAHGGCLAGLLEPLYESVLRPEALEVFLRRLSAELRADVAILVGDWPRPPGVMAASAPTTGRVPSVGPARTASPDLPQRLGPFVVRSGSDAASLYVFRPTRSGGFGARERALVSSLVPHLQRAMSLRRHANVLDATLNPLAAATDGLPTAAIVLKGDGTVVFANREAKCLLDRRDGLELGAEGLKAVKASDHRNLKRLIAAAAAQEPLVGGRDCLAVSRPSMKAPYLVRVGPAGATGTLSAADTSLAVVFIVDPDVRRVPRHTELVDAFHLTPAQARLAARLCGGERLADAAAAERTSTETARVHLKAAFRKTGTHRQAELVGLLLRTCALTAAPTTRGDTRSR